MSIAALLILAPGPAQKVDGEAALRLAERFVVKVANYRAPVMQSLTATDGKGWGFDEPAEWSVGFSVKGGTCSLMLSPKGKVLYFSASPRKRVEGSPDPRTPATRDLAWQFLKKIPHREPVALDEGLGVGVDGSAGAQFHLLVHGMRYFNLNPTYGYYMSFNVRSRTLLWFGKQEFPPPPNSLVAKVSAESAKQKLLAYSSAAKDKDGIARLLAPDWPGDKELRPELGYYAFKADSRARLVWRGVVYSGFRGQLHRSGSVSRMVDAISGEILKPDDSGMR